MITTLDWYDQLENLSLDCQLGRLPPLLRVRVEAEVPG